MNFCEWKKSNGEYGRKLVHSGLEGARSGQEEFLAGKPIAPFLGKSALSALTAAAIGTGIAILGALASDRRHSPTRILAWAAIGGVVGFGAGMAWESRELGESVVARALKNMEKVRDEHWLELNPIDYA